jgi:hypothetical protein
MIQYLLILMKNAYNGLLHEFILTNQSRTRKKKFELKPFQLLVGTNKSHK